MIRLELFFRKGQTALDLVTGEMPLLRAYIQEQQKIAIDLVLKWSEPLFRRQAKEDQIREMERWTDKDMVRRIWGGLLLLLVVFSRKFFWCVCNVD